MKTKSKSVLTECITPNCHTSQRSNGLCPKCLSAANLMCNRGETTKAKLISLGLMLPKQTKSLFRQAFANKTK